MTKFCGCFHDEYKGEAHCTHVQLRGEVGHSETVYYTVLRTCISHQLTCMFAVCKT